MKSAPIIETERLILRAHRKDDYSALANLWAEPAIYRHILGRPSTAEEAWARLIRYAGHWQIMGFGYWAIEDKASRTFIGELGFGDYHRDIVPSFDDRPEAGWMLSEKFQGQGLASEALKAAFAWLDKNVAHKESVCMIVPENTASIRLAQKFAFRAAHDTVYKGDKVTVFYRAKP